MKPSRLISRRELNLSCNREEQLKAVARFGIRFSDCLATGALLVSHCSGPKTGAVRAKPEGLYASARLQRFYGKCKELKQPFGILSDKYGLHPHDVSLPTYNTGPSDLSDSDLHDMGGRIRTVCERRGIASLHYVASPLSVMKPYLIMLLASGVPFRISYKVPSKVSK